MSPFIVALLLAAAPGAALPATSPDVVATSDPADAPGEVVTPAPRGTRALVPVATFALTNAFAVSAVAGSVLGVGVVYLIGQRTALGIGLRQWTYLLFSAPAVAAVFATLAVGTAEWAFSGPWPALVAGAAAGVPMGFCGLAAAGLAWLGLSLMERGENTTPGGPYNPTFRIPGLLSVVAAIGLYAALPLFGGPPALLCLGLNRLALHRASNRE